MFFEQYLSELSLVIRVGVTVHEGDGHGFDTLLPEPFGKSSCLINVERHDDFSGCTDTLSDFVHPLQGYHPRWLDPVVDTSPFSRYGLPGDLQQVPESLGSDQSDGGKAPLENGIDGDRCPVKYPIHLGV